MTFTRQALAKCELLLAAFGLWRARVRGTSLLSFLILLLSVPIVRADTIQQVATELKADVSEPFRFGVANDLASNLLTAQSLSPYASEESLNLSIESVVRAIGIDNTPYVGFSNMDPITWLQSTIAIDPGASIGFTPSALYFGSRPVTSTPEPETWVLILIVIVIAGGIMGWRWLQPRPVPPPVIITPYGPVTEWARKQAVTNMKLEPGLQAKVEKKVIAEMGGDVNKGMTEFRRRYPELF